MVNNKRRKLTTATCQRTASDNFNHCHADAHGAQHSVQDGGHKDSENVGFVPDRHRDQQPSDRTQSALSWDVRVSVLCRHELCCGVNEG